MNDKMQSGDRLPSAAGSEASPEEQAMYDSFVNNGYLMIYDDRSFPGIMERFQGDGTHVSEDLAHISSQVVMAIEDKALEAGKPYSPDVILHGGIEILEDIANTAREAGIHDFSQQEIEGAMYSAMDLYRTQRQQQGRLDDGALKQDFDTLVSMDQSGKLSEIMPGIETHFGGGT